MQPSASLPIPSFEDLRKLLEFWIGQQDKWFYFETGVVQSHSDNIPRNFNKVASNQGVHTVIGSNSTYYYIQTRVVGKIHDVVSFPPSLLLHESKVLIVQINYNDAGPEFRISAEERKQFGLVFSQITYYEPIEDISKFYAEDKRVNVKHGAK